jgi:class 3 adenylate cyclase
MTVIRRLAAILAADVAGYSRLIGADEEGTLNRLRAIRADVIYPKITEHRGRIVNDVPPRATVAGVPARIVGWSSGSVPRWTRVCPITRSDRKAAVTTM